MDMKEYYEIAQEQFLEEKIEEYINQGMEDDKAQERAEAEIANEGDEIYDRAVDMYSCHVDQILDRYRDSLY